MKEDNVREAEMKGVEKGVRAETDTCLGKTVSTHTWRPEIIFWEEVASLGLPRAHLAPDKPKIFASGRGREQMDIATQGVCTNLAPIAWKKGKGVGVREGNISQSEAAWLAGNSTMRPALLASLK